MTLKFDWWKRKKKGKKFVVYEIYEERDFKRIYIMNIIFQDSSAVISNYLNMECLNLLKRLWANASY